MNTQRTSKNFHRGVVSTLLIQHFLRMGNKMALPFEQIMKAANVREADLDPVSGWIELSILERLSAELLSNYPDPLISLKLLKLAEPAILGVLGYMVQCSPTLLDMFHAITEFGQLVSTASNASMVHEPGGVLWQVEHHTDDAFFLKQCDETYIISCAILVRRQYPQALQAVRFPHQPTLDDGKPHPIYQELCRCPVEFNQSHAALVLNPHTLNTPLPFADPVMFDSLRQHARVLISQLGAEPTLTHQVKEQLRHLLAQGISSREAVAESLGMSPRHLHRQLQAQGCHYQAILSELRSELAHKLLLQAQYNLEDIASKLGFGSERSFSRWFRTEMGITPVEFRHKSLASH